MFASNKLTTKTLALLLLCIFGAYGATPSPSVEIVSDHFSLPASSSSSSSSSSSKSSSSLPPSHEEQEDNDDDNWEHVDKPLEVAAAPTGRMLSKVLRRAWSATPATQPKRSPKNNPLIDASYEPIPLSLEAQLAHMTAALEKNQFDVVLKWVKSMIAMGHGRNAFETLLQETRRMNKEQELPPVPLEDPVRDALKVLSTEDASAIEAFFSKHAKSIPKDRWSMILSPLEQQPKPYTQTVLAHAPRYILRYNARNELNALPPAFASACRQALKDHDTRQARILVEPLLMMRDVLPVDQRIAFVLEAVKGLAGSSRYWPVLDILLGEDDESVAEFALAMHKPRVHLLGRELDGITALLKTFSSHRPKLVKMLVDGVPRLEDLPLWLDSVRPAINARIYRDLETAISEGNEAWIDWYGPLVPQGYLYAWLKSPRTPLPMFRAILRVIDFDRVDAMSAMGADVTSGMGALGMRLLGWVSSDAASAAQHQDSRSKAIIQAQERYASTRHQDIISALKANELVSKGLLSKAMHTYFTMEPVLVSALSDAHLAARPHWTSAAESRRLAHELIQAFSPSLEGSSSSKTDFPMDLIQLVHEYAFDDPERHERNAIHLASFKPATRLYSRDLSTRRDRRIASPLIRDVSLSSLSSSAPSMSSSLSSSSSSLSSSSAPSPSSNSSSLSSGSIASSSSLAKDPEMTAPQKKEED